MKRLQITLLIVAIFAFCEVRSFAKSADEILKETNVKGGLIVHLGCGAGKLTSALLANDSYIVHGLDYDSANIAKAKDYIQSQNKYGKVSVQQLYHDKLPYADNLVNLLISEDLKNITMKEVMRVLTPLGVAYVKENEKWIKTIKPWPDNIDEWTHYLHSASNNAVADDTAIGPLGSLQWTANPTWIRSHEHEESIGAMVSAKGRIFSFIDEAPAASVNLPSKWFLVARDAFNGVLLWKRPLEGWIKGMRLARSGPSQVQRHIVAMEDKVYVTLKYGGAVSELDAATGETIKTYSETEGTEEILYHNDVLLLLVGNQKNLEQDANDTSFRKQDMSGWGKGQFTIRHTNKTPPMENKTIIAINAKSGEKIWDVKHSEKEMIIPLTLTANNEQIYYIASGGLVNKTSKGKTAVRCIDFNTGEFLWQSEDVICWTKGPQFGVVLVAYKDVVLYGGSSRELLSISAKDGKTLWTKNKVVGAQFRTPPDLFVIDDLVWVGSAGSPKSPGFTKAYDFKTGEVKLERKPDSEYMKIGMIHHRCYRNKATKEYLVLGRDGTALIDIKSGEAIPHHWLRGTCQLGIMPCNGLMYVPPHPCACSFKVMLTGFNAVAPWIDWSKVQKTPNLIKGEAYVDAKNQNNLNTSNDWTTYRHDFQRSGFIKSSISSQLKSYWESEQFENITPPTIANGKVFISEKDKYTVHALSADNGKIIWSYLVSGRVDTPPTIYKGLVLFGCGDGYLYCLTENKGKIVWKFRLAKEDRNIIDKGMLSSTWAVHGSVLIKNDIIFAVSGRNSFLDGGISLYRINPITGEELSETQIYSPDENGREIQEYIGTRTTKEGAKTDVLSADDKYVYMQGIKFDFQGKVVKDINKDKNDIHLYCPSGFLDDSWFHRTYWIYGQKFGEGWGGWQSGNSMPAGRILCFNDKEVFGFGRNYFPRGSAGQWNLGEFYRFFATLKQPGLLKGKGRLKSSVICRWNIKADMDARAMVLTNDILFIAGPLGNTRFNEKAFNGDEGIALRAISTKNGETVSQYKLNALPVFDGMAIANNALYISLKNGKIICFK